MSGISLQARYDARAMQSVLDIKLPTTAGSKIFLMIALLAIAFVPMLPAVFSTTFPMTHEGLRYPSLTGQFAVSVAHGYLYPRWLPDLAGGAGYPTFVFYQPLFFFVSAAFVALPHVGTVVATYAAVYVFAAIGASGAYLLARRCAGRGTSLAAAALFMLTPIGFVNLYLRGDLSELAAMMLTPWPLFGTISAARRFTTSRPTSVPLGIVWLSLALIVYAHPAIALIYLPTIFCFALAGGGTKARRLRWIRSIVATFAIAAALSSAYWFVVFQNRGFVHLDRALSGTFSAEEHVVDPLRFIGNTWTAGYAATRSSGKAGGIPFQLGTVQLVFAIGGVALGWRRPWVRPLCAAYVLLIVVMTPLAIPVWHYVTPLRFVQFSWRLLSITAVFQTTLAAVGIDALAKLGSRRGLGVAIGWAGVAAAVALGHAMFSVVDEPVAVDANRDRLTWAEAESAVVRKNEGLPAEVNTFTIMNEFDPIWRQIPPIIRGTNGPMAVARVPLAFAPDSTPYRIAVTVTATTDDAVVLNQCYFPGFDVSVNGERVPDESLRANVLDDGRMIVPVPAGQSRIVAHYAGPQYWLARSIVSLIVVIGGGAFIQRSDRRAVIVSPSPEKSPAL